MNALESRADPGKGGREPDWEAVHPYSADGGYVNFMMDDGDDSRLNATYGDNYDRLVALKDKYDPTNFFRVNQNIRPLHEIEILRASSAVEFSHSLGP